MRFLLFDIDGTLLTAPHVGRRIVESALARIAGSSVDSSSVSFGGRTDRSLARELLTLSGVKEPEAVMDVLLDQYARELEATLRPPDVRVLPGVTALLDALSTEEHLHLGILTGNLERTGWAKLRAARIDRFFGFGAFGSDHEDRNRLPHFARDRAAARMGGASIDFSQMVVIGDTVHDVACGKAVGAMTVAVCTGFEDPGRLAASEPDLLLDDFTRPEPLYDLVLA